MAISSATATIEQLAAQGKAVADFPKLSSSADWPWWRGPSRNGVVSTTQLPIEVGDAQNVLWKSPVPGRGHSSPIVVAGQVILTTADEASQSQSVVAFDLATGKHLWTELISQGGFPENNHAKNTEATPTVASDGERIFAVFFHHKSIQATALDLRGKQIWQKTVGPFNPQRYEYGYAPSPLIYKNAVIIAAEHDGESYLSALDRETGNQVWKTARPASISFSTPVVGHVAGKDQLLISGMDKVWSYDPATGQLNWSAPGTATATCGTVVWEGDIVLASGGYPKSETVAIRADGSSRVLWKNNKKCYEQSMIVNNGHLYALTDNGIMYCWRISDGKEMWMKRLQGPISASPILSNGKIYWANESGTLYVVAANPAQFQLLAENKIGTEAFASPAVSDNRLILRVASRESGQRQELLYCFGEATRGQ